MAEEFPANEQVERHVPYRLLVNQRRNVVNEQNPLDVTVASAVSPFGDLIAVSREPVFSLSSVDPLSILRDFVNTSGTGTVTHTGDEYRCNAPASGDVARLETADVGRYLSGFASEVGTGIRLGALNGGEVAWGPFDGTDGFRYRASGSEIFVEVMRDSTVEISTERADWNIDKLDGTGPSGVDVGGDVEAFLQRGWIWQVRWTWYGYGAIEWRLVSLGPDGQRVWTVHRDKVENKTSIRQPNLPAWVEARGGAEVYVGGRQYAVIGGGTFATARAVGDFRIAQSIPDTGSWYPLIALRRNQSLPFASGVRITTEDYAVNSDIKVVVQAFVCPAGTTPGGAWVDVRNSPPGESAAQVNRSATSALNLAGCVPLDPLIAASGSGSTKAGGRASQASSKRTTIPRDLELVYAARGTGNNAATVDLSLAWLESR